jgi:hypothetical protein
MEAFGVELQSSQISKAMDILVVGTTYRALVITVGMPKGVQIEAIACGFGPSSGTFAEHVLKALWAGRRAREATADTHDGNRLLLKFHVGHVRVFL